MDDSVMGPRETLGVRGTAPYDEKLRRRFEKKFLPEPFSGCWLWMANTDGHPIGRNYGQIHILGRKRRAHHAAWRIYRGSIPSGLQVLHRCDTPLCVNPAHLFLGTPTDNLSDAEKKGRVRHLKGEALCISKLTEAKVREIRESPDSDADLAKRFDVHPATIWQAKNRYTWKHVK
jgi:hypothetical protein